MGKVTMQDLADALKVSRVTVWKVFNDYPGVSESLRNQINTKALEMGYLKSEQSAATEQSASPEQSVYPADKEDSVTVSVVVSRPDTSMFWITIIHCIAKQLAKHDINLMYTYLPTKSSDSFTLPAVLTNGSIQGMIVLNVYDPQLLQSLNKLRMPKVFLDIVTSIPEDTLTGDLLLLEGHNTIRKITSTIIEKGRKVIGFIGPTDYARTNEDRYEGFQSAMASHGLSIQNQLCLTGNIGIDTYQEEIHQFLNSLPQMPGAFICVNDFVANIVLQYLKEHGHRVPEDVAVSGYDGITEHGELANYLTTVQVDLGALGKRLARQLLYRMNDPDSPYEIIYLSFDVSFGDSTDF